MSVSKSLRSLKISCDVDLNKNEREIILRSLSECSTLTKLKFVTLSSHGIFTFWEANGKLKEKALDIVEKNRELVMQYARANVVKSAATCHN